ncbi:uroporphyrinogen-III C-methyltransferase [Limnobacter sp.]|uniref:uroporphyrinogen-III C-methyltransferase n=1 Tax=Limnobacter sp. TaxID=2003368 RepID=UPI0035112512
MTPTLVVCKPRLPDDYTVQKQALADTLRSLGLVNHVFFPVFDLKPLDEPIAQVQQWINQADTNKPRMVVFVSPSVLEVVIHRVGVWPKGVVCAVMGQQSRALALLLGVPEEQVLAPSGLQADETEDSDGLAKLIEKQYADHNIEVLVCKGPRGRTEFALHLRTLGHQVDVLECYDRVPVLQTQAEVTALLGLAGNAVLWVTSSETATVLNQQLEAHSPLQTLEFKRLCTVLTTHPRITSKCKELGFANVSQIPTGIQSVHDWLNTKKKSMDKTPQQANPVAVSQSSSARPVSAPTSSGPSWLAKAAFFVSVLSFVLVLLIAFAGKNQIEKTRLAFGERIQKESTTLEIVKEEVRQTGDLFKDMRTRFELLEQAQKEEASQRASLEEVYNSLLASRTEVSVSEVEQLISIAKRQLYLLGNVNGAAIALAQAIELLERTDKPSLLNLRTAIESDLAQIKALPADDLLRMAISLDAVVNTVEVLPMLSGANATNQTNLAELTEPQGAEPANVETTKPETASVDVAAAEPAALPEGTESANIWKDAWAWAQSAIKAAWYDVRSLIEISKVNSPEVLMLSARQETDLRNTLRLSLLNARISLLSRQADLLKSDLQRSTYLLDRYFDPKAVQVQRAKSVIQELHAIQVDLVLPELKATNAALRLVVAAQQGERQ